MIWLFFLASAVFLWLFTNRNYTNRHLLRSKIRRMVRWEFWPSYVFYIPIALYSILLGIKNRSFTAFYAANPGLLHGGMYGENKAAPLAQIAKETPEMIADFVLIEPATAYERVALAQTTLHDKNWHYPIILKPDHGCRGQNVSIINNLSELSEYIVQHSGKTIMQEYIGGLEFGIFYMRFPDQAKGEIFSIAEKTFPVVVGDGKSTLKHLILSDPHANYHAPFLLELHQDNLQNVLKLNEEFRLVKIGSHCKGSIFLDKQNLMTQALSKVIDSTAHQIDEFYFGRFDIRVPSLADLQAGQNIKILEVNGVTSEAAHIYDPKHGVLFAYSIMLKQWKYAFAIGKQNMMRGCKTPTIKCLLNEAKLFSSAQK